MWSPLTGGDGEVLTGLAQRFSSENGMGITVNHVPQGDYMLQLNNAAGQPAELPEMTVARVINVGELAARNIIVPWPQAAMDVFGDITGDFPEDLWTRGEYNGQRYAVPLDTSILVMYYNKDMFAAANVTEPASGQIWTAEEFDAALTALENSGVEPIAVGDQFNGATLFQSVIVQLGGSIASEDGTQATFNSPQGVEALNTILELRNRGAAGISGAGDPEVNVFKQQQAAIVIHGPWHIGGMREVADFEVGYAPLPQIAGTEYAVWAGSHQFALISPDPAAQTAAACWVRWVSDRNVEWGGAGQFPARNNARSDPQLATIAPEISRVASSVEGAIILPQVPGLEGTLWGPGFAPVIDRAFAGEIQPDQFQAELDAAAAASQQLIDANAEQYGSGASPSP